MKQSKVKDSTARSIPENAIATGGEVFSDGFFVELIRPRDFVHPTLLLWDGHEQVVGDVVTHNNRRYKPRFIGETVSREVSLPAGVGGSGSTRELVAEIRELFQRFVGLPEKSIALIARFVLATWLVDTMQTAPRLLICGPDSVRMRQLLQLLRCFCRRALPLTSIGTADLCSLATGMRFTLVLRQQGISPKLAAMLQAATIRGNPLLRAGELLDLFGAQVISSCDSSLDDGAERAYSIRVSCMPMGEPVNPLDSEQQQRIVEEFQGKLLAFRFSNYQAAIATAFDASAFAFPLQDLATSLAAATPGDLGLQAELLTLFQEQSAEIENANWVDLDTVIIEAILVHCREAKHQSVYVGDIAEMAEVVLTQRGELRRVDAGDAGRRLKGLGFVVEPRDARGVKLRLTNEVCVRVESLARQFHVPGATFSVGM